MRFFVLLAAILGAGSAVAETELLMIERDGCLYCARWDREIAPVYPKTTEGRAAPLRRHNLHDPLPGDIQLARKAVFTPTFILLVDGEEQGRLEGYAGDQFFWSLVDDLIKQAGVALEPAS